MTSFRNKPIISDNEATWHDKIFSSGRGEVTIFKEVLQRLLKLIWPRTHNHVWTFKVYIFLCSQSFFHKYSELYLKKVVPEMRKSEAHDSTHPTPLGSVLPSARRFRVYQGRTDSVVCEVQTITHNETWAGNVRYSLSNFYDFYTRWVNIRVSSVDAVHY